MVYSNGNFVYAIGGIPVGSGSATPPPPPPPPTGNFTLSVGGQSGRVSASAAAWRNPGDILPYSTIMWTDETAQATGLDYGSLVAVRMSSAPYYAVGTPEISGLSATGISGGQGEPDGTYVNITGYITADAIARLSASAGAKTFTIYAVSGNTSCQLTGSGSGDGDTHAGSDEKVRMPLRMTNTFTSEYFPSSCVVVRQTSEYGNTAEVFEPLGLSAVGFSAAIAHNAEDASWSNPNMITRFNFDVYGVEAIRFTSRGTERFTGTITANLSSGYVNNLSSRTTASTALGFSSLYLSEGTKTYGNFTVLGWTATAITK